ncbi:LytR C-terminal domain-containing protein [Canibacter sp. lx-45]|uniref:LytR C-terminal domain-containing protein n=1 Tax=Canibacter zhuwentaonis TaxID=2837491 RepID=UPI001BDDC579|nr:LytR C-terminal domain-containing protein [Canibacter zhuwentaonis]MBT1035595.1 LytR C-terminal domain-containing protein [Canibacter zhuwentaonis]
MAENSKISSDRFDEMPIGGVKGARLGAHRAAPKTRYTGRWVLAVLVMTVVFASAGIVFISIQGAEKTVFSDAAVRTFDRIEAQKPATPEPETPPAAPELADKVDPNRSVAVVNASQVAGLARSVANHVKENSLGMIGVVGNAERGSDEVSRVYHVLPEHAEAARALARELGGLEVVESRDYASYGADLVVVLEGGYAGPGAPERAAP